MHHLASCSLRIASFIIMHYIPTTNIDRAMKSLTVRWIWVAFAIIFSIQDCACVYIVHFWSLAEFGRYVDIPFHNRCLSVAVLWFSSDVRSLFVTVVNIFYRSHLCGSSGTFEDKIYRSANKMCQTIKLTSNWFGKI